jgi:putative PEP-CTERM system TPR-repeat lipoprotein
LLDALGRAQQLSGDGNQALLTFNKLAGMQPLSPLPYMRMAEVHMAVSKDKGSAAQSLRKALELKPDLLDAQRGLILLATDAKDYSGALTIARSVQEQRPKEAVGFQLEGDIAASQKKWDAAADAYRTGLKQGAVPALAIKLYAALGAAGKTAAQDKFANSWLADNPTDAVMRLLLGDTAIAGKNYADAEKFYSSVIRIQPNNAVAYNNLAWVTGKLNKGGAVGYAEKAIALAPNQPAFMDTLAMLLSEKGDYANALEWQTKALALQPENGTYRLNLARIHVKGDKKDLARKELDVLAKLGDKFAAQAEVAALLKSL